MTVSSLSGSSFNDRQSLAATLDARESGGANAVDPNSGRIREAAKDFEAVLLRQMLSALERTTKVSNQGSAIAGQQTYGSMVVEAVADAVASAGGLGLADLIAGALTPNQGRVPSDPQSPGPVTSDPSKESRSQRESGAGVGQHRTHAEPSIPKTEPVAVRSPRNSSQAFAPHAVPNTEIRTTSSQATGQMADRRFR